MQLLEVPPLSALAVTRDDLRLAAVEVADEPLAAAARAP